MGLRGVIEDFRRSYVRFRGFSMVFKEVLERIFSKFQWRYEGILAEFREVLQDFQRVPVALQERCWEFRRFSGPSHGCRRSLKGCWWYYTKFFLNEGFTTSFRTLQGRFRRDPRGVQEVFRGMSEGGFSADFRDVIAAFLKVSDVLMYVTDGPK